MHKSRRDEHFTRENGVSDYFFENPDLNVVVCEVVFSLHW